MMLYEDMKDGVITKEDYVELHAAYEARGKEAQEAGREGGKRDQSCLGRGRGQVPVDLLF